MEEVLVLFSGGKDSFLSTILMLEKKYLVNLVNFDNGTEIHSSNVIKSAKRIQKKYGSEAVNIIGIKKTDAIFRNLIKDIYNFKIDYINKEIGNITISQFNCLACRLSMYILSIIICKKYKINKVVDGARRSQLFAIEQDKMIDCFKSLFKKYDIEIIYPVLDYSDDFEVKNKILASGFVPKMNEAQCLLGMPLTNNLDDDTIDACIKVYQEYLLPKIDSLINDYIDFDFDGKYI